MTHHTHVLNSHRMASASASLATPAPGHSTGERLIRMPELVATLGISRATAYRYVASGKLPAPVRLSTRCVAWKASMINAWMAELPKA
jgi:prophage regulatory protein